MDGNPETIYRYGDREIKVGGRPGRNGQGRSGRSGKPGKNKGLVIFLIIIACFIALGVLIRLSGIGDLLGDDLSGAGDISEDYVGVLYVEGTISEDSNTYSHEYVLDAIDGMMDNSSNKGMLLYVNTPGGGVYESDEVYLRIKEYQDTTKRPVYVYMASQATSGGYYISASADRIIANRNCWTGSIGVTMGTFLDLSGLMEKYGVGSETITSGKNKAMGSMTEPMTKEQKEIFQSMVDEAYDQFTGIVAEGRNMDLKKVRKLADGRIYTAKQAKENGLIDEIADTYDDAEAKLISDNQLYSCEIYDFRYEPEESLFGGLVSGLERTADDHSGQGDLAALNELIEKADVNSIPLEYMCPAVKK